MKTSLRSAAVAAVLLASAAGARGGDPPGQPPGQSPAPEDAAAAQKKKRIELDERRGKLPETAKAAMQLLDRFRDRDFRVWSTSRAQIVGHGADAVPALLVSLEEIDWETRAFAAGCLADIKAETAAGALADAFERETFTEAKRQFVLAMATLKSPTTKPTLLKAAASEDDGLRIAATRGLAAFEDPQLKDALSKLASDQNLDIKYEARGGLAALHDAATVKGLVDEAKAMVKDRDIERVASKEIQDNGDRYAQYLLGLALARADEQKEVYNLISDVLTAEKPWDHKSFLRMGVAEGLGRRSALKGKVDPRLVSGMSHKEDSVRTACSYAAGWVGSAELLPKLKEALSDAQLDVRYNAVRALGRIGTPEAAKLLDRSLIDKAGEVRLGTVRSLGIVRGPEATKALLDALKDDKYVVRILAARHLAHRTAEEGVLDALQKAAKDKDYGVREQALAALAHHPDAPAVLPVIAQALDDQDFGVRTNACLGLAALGQASLGAADAVGQSVATMYLGAKEPRLVRGADEALDAVRFPSAVPVLLDGLGSDTEETRRRANLALSKMGETGVGYDPSAPKDQRLVMAKKWRDWWTAQGGKLPARGRRARNSVTGTFAESAKDLKWKGIDIALLFDSTGSMGGLINAAKERIDEIADDLHDLLPSLRVSVYTYRDFGSDYVFYGTPLTYDTWKLPAFLQDASAGQGGDLPEAVFENVSNCCDKLLWRPDAHKVIVYAGDASHHPESTPLFLESIKKFFTEKNHAVLHAIFTATGRRSLDVTARQKREEWGKQKSTVFDLFKLTAEAGRGRAIPLENESALIKELLVLTFGETFRADVENLLDFER
jgi:HEAT repeat protein